MMGIERIEIEKSNVKPDYKPLARALLDEMREFFNDSANEAEFQRWKAEQDAKKGA